MSLPEGFCPFVGIEPFTEAHRDYFFGRDREQRIIISNLYATPLTVLYGAIGVGKTSVVLAGLVPKLRDARHTAVVVFRNWHDETFIDLLKADCVSAIEDAQRKPCGIDLSLPFDEFLLAATQFLKGTLLLIFDQFEEYFLYHQTPTAQAPFEAEFARAVNREEIDANFLLVLREDWLAKLDRFKSRIPTLLSNLVQLHHMDLDAAGDAIRGPLEVYNARLTDKDEAVSIEDKLVTSVLGPVPIGLVQLTDTTVSGAAREAKTVERIEAPFLQMVMTRLWEEERKARSRVLRNDTLIRLGGARTIVRTHLDNLMNKLHGKELDLCARIFDRLVTPSGSKIALKETDLSKYAGDLADLLPRVLQKLSPPEAGILRIIPVPGVLDERRYEIYHDVLASAILEWRDRYVRAQQETSRKKRQIARMSVVALIVIVGLTVLALKYYFTWKEVRPWGTLNDLSTGSVHVLHDATISIGRNAKDLGYETTVMLSGYVSRIHLLLNKNLKAMDMRSLNGTTVNEDFLVYGRAKELKNGDIIVLADAAPFQFHELSYAPYQFWDPAVPPGKGPLSGAWGMFLDLVSKEVTYLTEGRYFVSGSGQKGLAVTPDRTGDWICSFGINAAERLEIEARRDAVNLYAEVKTGDTYTYRKGLIPPGRAYDYFAWEELGWGRTEGRDDMKENERTDLGVSQAIFHTSTGRHFRILFIVPNLEPTQNLSAR